MNKLIICDDQAIVRAGLISLLNHKKNLEISEVESQQGLSKLSLSASDIIILTAHEITEENFVAIRTIRSQTEAKIFLIVSECSLNKLANLFILGLNGFLFMESTSKELSDAVDFLLDNEQYLDRRIGLQLLSRYIQNPIFKNADSPITFTDREEEILKLISQGYTNQKIADKIFVSKRTVEGYRQSLLMKTGANNTASLIRFAYASQILVE